jgi:hypothetical protein
MPHQVKVAMLCWQQTGRRVLAERQMLYRTRKQCSTLSSLQVVRPGAGMSMQAPPMALLAPLNATTKVLMSWALRGMQGLHFTRG